MVRLQAGLTAMGVLVVGFGLPSILPDSLALRSAAVSENETMVAAAFERHGPADVLKTRPHYPRPIAGKGMVLIRLSTASINPVDFKLRRNAGAWPFLPKPKIPSMDLAGVVVEGPPDSRFKAGDRVAAMMPILNERWGASAQFAAVHERFVAKVPANVTLQQAASLPLVSLTVIQAFNRLGDDGLRGKKVLIHAGAGGVGTFALQFAKLQGAAQVITTCSRGKSDLCRDLGADVTVDYRTEMFEEYAGDVDVILDTMSYSYEQRSLAVLSRKGQHGHYLNILSSDWRLPESGIERANGLTTAANLIASFLPNIHSRPRPRYSLIAVEPNGAQLQTVLNHVAAGEIRPVIDRTFPLAEAAAAHSYLEEGHATGKVRSSRPPPRLPATGT